jgi:hypothetical protein
MIINLRGTHGSGKSTVVLELLKKYKGERLGEGNKRPEGYAVQLPGVKKPLYVVGAYETQCGGADTIQPYATIWPRVEAYAKLGHVIFEGALVSCSVGSLGERMIARKKDCVVGYLDTPVEECLRRIEARRAAKGVTGEFNRKNTENKFKSTAATRPKFEAAGVKCVTLSCKKGQAAKQVEELLRGGK